MDFHILNDDNLKIRYAVGGSKGEIVLLIHGLGGRKSDKQYWYTFKGIQSHRPRSPRLWSQ